MRRISLVILIIAAVACSHSRPVADSHQERPTVADSNVVTFDELQADARAGHVFLYDALESTRPHMLESAGDRGWPWVFFVEPSQQLTGPSAVYAFSPVTDIRWLEKVPTSQVKCVRRYRSRSAPAQFKAETDWLLVVALR